MKIPRNFLIPLLVLAGLGSLLHAAPDFPTDRQTNSIYQYFIRSTATNVRGNSGAYLWIPPNTPKIRAVMVGIHNALAVNILESPPVRATCRANGIAQILMTPNGSEIGPVMLKDLNFDITNPEKTEVYDRYLSALAEQSGHPELVSAPIVPLAHSAYASFPFDAAMRKPEQCLGAIPIKAGLPDQYTFYGTGGKALNPNPELCMRNVPILFIGSASQETVGWSAYPHQAGVSWAYRQDRDDNPGTEYQPKNDLFGMNWDMMSGHFDMMPRNFQFVADWLDEIAKRRLPGTPGEPLKNLQLADGWLIDPAVPPTGELSGFPSPASYSTFTGTRKKALWFPSQSLAETQFALCRDEQRKEIETFTYRDTDGQPVSLAHGSMAPITNPQVLVKGDGFVTLTTYHFTAPFDVCTVKDKDHAKHPEQPHSMANVLFPDKTSLPVSNIPLQFTPNGGPLELVKAEPFTDERGVAETRLTLKMIRHRLAPDPGFQLIFGRAFHEGNEQFAAAGRTFQIGWVPQDMSKGAARQTIDFPAVPDSSVKSQRIPLAATSSAALPVEYFVVKGPGIVKEGAFIPMEIPVNLKQPIDVTIGAYQVGKYEEEGAVKPAQTVYQTFKLLP